MEEPIARELARMIRGARDKAGLSEQALADRLGVSQATVSKWERAETLPRHHRLGPLERTLRLPAGSLHAVYLGHPLPPRNIEDEGSTEPIDDALAKLEKVRGLLDRLEAALLQARR